MKDTNRTDDWRVLCELASKETDPEKLVDLIIQINQTLDESHKKSRYLANAFLCSVAPQLSQPAEYDC